MKHVRYILLLIIVCSVSIVATLAVVQQSPTQQDTPTPTTHTTYYLAICDASGYYKTTVTDIPQVSTELVHAHWWLVPQSYYLTINRWVETGVPCSQTINN